MSLISSFDLSATGMSLQRRRVDIAAENLANINSTETSDGGPYRRKEAIISSTALPFEASLNHYVHKRSIQMPKIAAVEKSKDPPIKIYDPQHPHADEKGFVAMPNISSTQEMVNLMTASIAYEANMSAFNEAKTMVMRTLEMGGI